MKGAIRVRWGHVKTHIVAAISTTVTTTIV